MSRLAATLRHRHHHCHWRRSMNFSLLRRPWRMKNWQTFLRQIEAYESRQFPCAAPDESIPSTSTYMYVEAPATSQSLKRPLSKSLKGKEKAKKQQ